MIFEVGSAMSDDVRVAVDTLNEEAYSLLFSHPLKALDLAATAASAAEAAGYQRGLVYALRTSGACRCLTSQLERAAFDLHQAQRIAEELSNEVAIAHVRAWLGSVARRVEGPAAAMTHYVEALTAFRAHGEQAGEASVLVSMGNIYADLRAFGRALEMFLDARSIAEATGDEPILVMVSGNIAGVYAESGDNERAFTLYEEVLRFAQKADNSMMEAITLLNIAIAARRMRHPGFTPAWLTSARSKLRVVGMRRVEGTALLELGSLYAETGDLAGALEIYQASIELGQSLGDRSCEIEGIIHAGEILGRMGDAATAAERLLLALDQAREYGSPALEGEVHEALAALYESKGDSAAALRHLRGLLEVSETRQRAETQTLLRAREEVEAVERAVREAELQTTRAELQVLKAQMQPHFLLNTLNGIAALLLREPAAADAMLVRLGDLLRLALRHSAAQELSVGDEIAFLAQYLALEQLRLERPLRVSYDVDPGVLGARIPHFLLQPLVENAIRHGGLDRHDDPELLVEARITGGGTLMLSVTDNGVGLPCDGRPMQMGVGLRNTRERLARLYGPRFSLELRPRVGSGTRAVLQLPLG